MYFFKFKIVMFTTVENPMDQNVLNLANVNYVWDILKESFLI